MDTIVKKILSVIIPRKLLDILIYLRVKCSSDRITLEKGIFPFFINSKEYKNILFVGVANYTSGYPKIFKDTNFWTMDFDPDKKIYGAVNHIVGSVTNIERYFARDYFNVIFLCGVVGWGLNKKEDIEYALLGINHCLCRNGILVLGWNDTPTRSKNLKDGNITTKSFRKYTFSPLGSWEYRTESRKYKVVFNFYQK